MRNLLAFVAFVVLAFLGAGWYLDWYTFKPVKADPSHQSYNIDFDRQKIARDIAKGVHDGQEKLGHALDKIPRSENASPGDAGKDQGSKPTLLSVPTQPVIQQADDMPAPVLPGRAP